MDTLRRVATFAFGMVVVMGLVLAPTAVGQTLTARYDHESGNPLADDTGNGNTLTNGGTVTFGAPIAPGSFLLGSVAGNYPRNGTGYLDAPAGVYTANTDLTYTALVRKNSYESAGHQTILASSRFRFQYQNNPSGGSDGGRLILDTSVPTTGGGGPAGAFQTQQWYFVGLVYNDSTNGIQAYLQPDSPVFFGPHFTMTAGSNLGNMTNFRMGVDGVSGIGGADAYGGQIDGARFYQGTMSKAELRDVFRQYRPAAHGATEGLLAKYQHEGPDPLTDDTGHLATLSNGGGVTFGTPPQGELFRLGHTVGEYPRANNGYLNVPNGVYVPGDDFTFMAAVRKDSSDPTTHQTILASSEFRLQYNPGSATGDGTGQLYFQIDGQGAVTSGNGTFDTEEWYFVAMRYNATTGDVDLFLEADGDCVLGAPAMSASAGGSNLINMTNLRIGVDGVSGIGGTDPFGGHMDHIRFYDEFLSDEELARLLQYEYMTPEPGTMTLLALGGLGLLRRRRRRR
ncbi:PEP-CTERM sorting domain-containing protein [bacterium]|nr:PEP-CTERM sorting domain-containing protein [bacterium]